MKKRQYQRSVLRYWSTQYRRIFDIEVQIHISISKNLQYWSSDKGSAAPARAGLQIAIAGCSSVLCTYCSVTISLQVIVYPLAPAAAVPGCRREGVSLQAGPPPAIRRRQWRPRSATKFSMVSHRILCLHSPADQHTKDTVSIAEQIGISPNKIILLKFCFQAQRLEEQLCALGPTALAKRSMLWILLAWRQKFPSDCPESTRQKAYAWDTSCHCPEHSPTGVCSGYFLPLPWALATRHLLRILLAIALSTRHKAYARYTSCLKA